MSEIKKQGESMLVRNKDLDKLLLLAGEVIIVSSNQEIFNKKLSALRDKQLKIDNEALDLSKNLVTLTSSISSELHRLVQGIRTVNLEDLGFRARRLVRDLSRKTGKTVDFEFIGEETTIDKLIMEKIYDPISHQLRNTMDHGIEDIETRLKKGKPEKGKVILSAYNTEQETILEISDDGSGIDIEKLKEKAIAKGIITANSSFTDELILSVMCAPGISTSKVVSEISGRGVGMDVVKSQLDELGGSISFKTKKGQGTAFTIRIPRTSAVNIVDALVIREGQNYYAIPILNIVSSLSIPKSEIKSAVDKGYMIKYLDHLYPLHSINHILDNRYSPTNWQDSEIVSVLIVEHKTKKVAFSVNEFLAPQKLVIIPFCETITVKGLVGTTILGGKHLGLIVDVSSLINLAMGDESVAVARKLKVEKDVLEEGTSAFKEKDQTEQIEGKGFYGEDSFIGQEFIIEIERLLPELNKNVFELESDSLNLNLINSVFRLFHTIKGNLIMMGLSKSGETVHGVETVLDHVRSSKLEIIPEVMDIIMDGVSFIQDVIKSVISGEEKDVFSEDIISRSAKFIPAPSFERKEIMDIAGAEIKLSHESAYRAWIHRRNKAKFYRMYIEFDPGGQPSFLIACLIYKRVCEVGDVIGTVPSLFDIEKGLMHGKMKLLFTSSWKIEELKKGFDKLLKEHYGALLIDISSTAF